VRVQLLAPRGRGRIGLAAGVEGVPRHPIFGGGEGDGEAVLGDRFACAAVPRIFTRCQVVRQVDHKARIPAGRPLGDFSRIDHQNPLAATELGEAAGRREVREAGADDQPVRDPVAVEAPDGFLSHAEGQATGLAGIDRQAMDHAFGHRIV
jgi:hypothetical protein